VAVITMGEALGWAKTAFCGLVFSQCRCSRAGTVMRGPIQVFRRRCLWALATLVQLGFKRVGRCRGLKGDAWR
jgi:hypothetical protein